MSVRRLIGGAKQLAARLGAGGSQVQRATQWLACLTSTDRTSAGVTIRTTTGSSNETVRVSFTETVPKEDA